MGLNKNIPQVVRQYFYKHVTQLGESWISAYRCRHFILLNLYFSIHVNECRILLYISNANSALAISHSIYIYIKDLRCQALSYMNCCNDHKLFLFKYLFTCLCIFTAKFVFFRYCITICIACRFFIAGLLSIFVSVQTNVHLFFLSKSYKCLKLLCYICKWSLSLTHW